MAPTLTAPALAGSRVVQLSEPLPPGTPVSIGVPGRHEHTRVEACHGSTGRYTVTLVYSGILRHGHASGAPVAVLAERSRVRA